MFADDVKIFGKVINLADARELQNDLNTLNNWCKYEYLLSINTNKCYIMTTTRKLTLNQYLFNYNINGTPLLKVDSFKDLGVTFDSKHSFNIHLSTITNKSFRMLGTLLQNFVMTSKDPPAPDRVFLHIVEKKN